MKGFGDLPYKNKGVFMKKLLSVFAAVLTVLPFVIIPEARAVSFPLKEAIVSESAMLINLDCDTVVHEKNADVKQMPGPLVNIMTAVIVLEECNDKKIDRSEEITLDPDVYTHIYDTMNKNGYSNDLPRVDLYDGDVLTVEDLLYCMMLTSSVEASETLAYHSGGKKVSAFVEKMNAKASEIGMTSTNFKNPTGMFDKDQYTTARDMAKLTQYALKVPGFKEIATTYNYAPKVPNPKTHPKSQNWSWTNSNLMMDSNDDHYYMGASGIKTGNLVNAGRNIVVMASKDGNTYLAILLKSPINDLDGNPKFFHIEDAISVFDWAFKHFSYQTILADTAEVGELKVDLADGNDYVLVRPKEEFSLLWNDEVDVSLIKKDKIVWDKKELRAPVKKGDKLGMLTLEYSGEELGTVEIVAVSDVKRSKSKYNFEAIKKFPKSDWFKNALKISAVLCLIYIMVCVYAWLLFKKKGKPLKPIYAVPKMEKKKKKNNNSK